MFLKLFKLPVSRRRYDSIVAQWKYEIKCSDEADALITALEENVEILQKEVKKLKHENALLTAVKGSL